MRFAPSAINRTFRALAGPGLLIILSVCMLHRALFSGGKLVPAWPYTDLFEVYLPWRYFGFTQWKQGHFPFWNPHVFCGIPFFAQIQSALLYPIAWVNFLCNTATAVTLEMILNLSAGAICTYAWARQRRLSRPAATLSGAIFAFSGPFYEHVTVGYLTVLATLAWAPLVFLAVDRLLEERISSGVIIGAIAICLQCLAGHAQLLYYTVLVAGLYVLLFSIGRRRAWRLYAGFIAMCLLGAMLSAVQWLPGYCATQLSVRAGGTSYGFASVFSLPFESLLTLIIPYPLGDNVSVAYVGRWYLWETSIYIGVISLVLACIGLATLPRSHRWRISVLLAAVLVLALGKYTPVYHLLYDYLPGFNLFRGVSKFGALWTLMLAILAGHGWQQMQRGGIGWRVMLYTAIACALCITLGIIVNEFNTTAGPIARLLHALYRSNEYYCKKDLYFDPNFLKQLTAWMSRQWFTAAALLALTCVLLLLRSFSVMFAYLLLAAAVLSLCAAGSESTPLAPTQLPFPPQWVSPVISATEHDQRLMFSTMAFANFGEMLQFNSIWGYDTGQPKRYSQLIVASQDAHPASLETYDYGFRRVSRLLPLLRCRYILQLKQDQPFLTVRDPLPHLWLVGNCIRMSDPAAMADRLVKDFDFRHCAILESDPAPAPSAAGAAGHVQLLRQNINELEIEADLPAPALLLITDAYAPGWQVHPLESNPRQSHYEVLRADDVLRVIPLSAGHHHFDLYYTPPGLLAGVCGSAAGIILWLAGMVFALRRKRVGVSEAIHLH